MKRTTYKIPNMKTLPEGAKRIIHPRLGVRCWLIDGKYYRTRRDYLYPPTKKVEGKTLIVDLSLPD